MGAFDEIKASSKMAIDAGESYVEHTKAYYELKVFRHTATGVITALKFLVIGSTLLLGIAFLVLASALALGAFLGNMVYGFLITGAGALLIAAILYLFRKKMEKWVLSRLSALFFKSV